MATSSTIDREKECPFLLRVFTHKGGHNHITQYTIDSLPKEELSLYTWKNATLEELAKLIEQVIPEAQDPDARVAFRLVYLDTERARYQTRDIGRVVAAKPTEDQKKTLEQCQFYIGDFLDVAVYVGPPPINQMKNGRSYGGSGGGRGRDRYPTGGRFTDRPPKRDYDRRGAAPYNRDRRPPVGGRRRGDRF